MSRLLALLLVLPLAASAGPGPDAPWTRASTEHFVVSGDAPAADIAQLAARLETLRGVLLDTLPRVDDRSILPSFVIAFGSDQSFQPWRSAGGTVGAYAFHEPFMPCMVLRSQRSSAGEDAVRVVVHEYVHVLADAPWMPLWLIEGIGDYYSTTTLSRDGRRAELGHRIPYHIEQATRWWLPLPEVLGTSRAAPLADDENGRSIFAESWLLVHYLMRATPGKGSQIARFIEMVAAGMPEAQAFEQAIGQPELVEAHLRRYLRNPVSFGEERPVKEAIDARALRPRPMTAAEVDATIGRLLFHLGRGSEAEQRLEAAIGAEPGLAEAMVTRGALRLRQGRRADALGDFRRASALDPANLFAAYQVGLMALEGSQSARGLSFDDAYAAMARAAEGRRDLAPEALATLGTLAGRVGQLAEAESRLRQAGARDPRQAGTKLELANVCLRVGKFQEAREILDGLASTPGSGYVQVAVRCLEWLRLAEARAQLRAELAQIAGLRDAGPDGAIRKTGSFPSPPRVRAPGAGEERRLGLLDAVDCPGGTFVARVSTRSGPVSLSTVALSGVHLSTARSDVTGALPCGPRAGREAVYVTWKGDHQLVALEFLPDDLQPGR